MTKLGFFTVIAFAAASCAAPENTTTADTVASAGKPGAAVSFSHALQAPVGPGGNGVLTLSIGEKYDTGAMEISAASDGLDLAAASRAKNILLDGASSHRWDIYFSAPTAGVYYINFTATVMDLNGVSATRSYAAAVQVGDATAAAKPDTPAVLDADGEPVMIMEAEETVEE